MNSNNITNLFPDYTCIFCAAQKQKTKKKTKKTARYGRAMGGIIVFIRNEFKQYFSEIDISCNFEIFNKCSKTLFNLEKDTVMAFTYLPPSRSPFYEQYQQSDIVLLKDSLLTVLASLSDAYILLMGDFNCRTGNLKDYYELSNSVPILEEFDSFFDNFMTPRSSCDNVITSSGRRLLEFCKTYGLYIANGRLGKDKNKGSFTYIGPKGCSLIDYLLLSRELFDCISDFSVETRTESSHLPVTVDFCTTNYSDKMVTAEDNMHSENIFSRLPKDINMFLENIKNVFTHEFAGDIFAKIDDVAADVNEIILYIVNTLEISSNS